MTYAVGVLASLLVAGSVSDDVGRRPVLLVALAALIESTGLFIIASSVVWLYLARALQGVATGIAISSASAPSSTCIRGETRGGWDATTVSRVPPGSSPPPRW